MQRSLQLLLSLTMTSTIMTRDGKTDKSWLLDGLEAEFAEVTCKNGCLKWAALRSDTFPFTDKVTFLRIVFLTRSDSVKWTCKCSKDILSRNRQALTTIAFKWRKISSYKKHSTRLRPTWTVFYLILEYSRLFTSWRLFCTKVFLLYFDFKMICW